MPAKKKTSHTFKEIVKALLTLRDEGYDLPLVANNLNIPKIMLTGWSEEYGEEIWAAHPIIIQDAAGALKSKMSRQHEAIRIKAEGLAEKLVDLMMDKLDEQELTGKNTLRDLTMLFREVVPYILPKFESENKIKNVTMEGTYEIFIEKMFDKLHSTNETPGNKTKGATKELRGRG